MNKYEKKFLVAFSILVLSVFIKYKYKTFNSFFFLMFPINFLTNNIQVVNINWNFKLIFLYNRHNFVYFSELENENSEHEGKLLKKFFLIKHTVEK